MKDFSQFKILLIEDDLDLLSLLKENFQIHFENVVAVCDGASAYLAFRDESFDLVVSDVRMPGFSGLELLAHVRSQGHHIPFVLLSGVAEKQDVMKALKLGARDFIEKPYGMEQVLASVFAVIEMERREKRIRQMSAEFGEEDDRVRKQKRMVGLLQATSATRKVS